jgi:hypothetical protein
MSYVALHILVASNFFPDEATESLTKEEHELDPTPGRYSDHVFLSYPILA